MVKIATVSLGAVLVVGAVFFSGCNKSNPVAPTPLLPDTTGRVVMIADGFEGDLSKWATSYLFAISPAATYYPQMRITTDAAHSGTHSVTADSSNRALVLKLSTAQQIDTGVCGIDFYFMAKAAGGINFTVQIGLNGGSSSDFLGGYGIGFDTTNKLKCTYYDVVAGEQSDSLYTTLVPGQWYKGTVEISYTTNTVNYYIDGVQKRSLSLSSDFIHFDRVLVVRGLGGPDGPKPYYVDDIKLYTK